MNIRIISKSCVGNEGLHCVLRVAMAGILRRAGVRYVRLVRYSELVGRSRGWDFIQFRKQITNLLHYGWQV